MTRTLAGLLILTLLWPSLAIAQATKAGVVTVLEGNVTARRVALPDAPVSLKFKDDVFLRDTVITGDKALARMLLGGKAVVTVRERSTLTITEVPGRSTLELASGKFSLAVAREKMGPNEEIQVRTPNAVAGVRGTVLVTEVERHSAQLGTGTPAVVTNFYVIRGNIVAQQLDTAGQPTGSPLPVGNLQSYSAAGAAPPRLGPVPPEQVPQILVGLQPTGKKPGISEAALKVQAVQTAVALVSSLTGDTRTTITPPPRDLRTQAFEPRDVKQLFFKDGCGESKGGSKCGKVLELIKEHKELFELESGLFLGDITLTKKSAKVFSGNFTSTQLTALFAAVNAVIFQVGDGVPFILVINGANVSLAGPLLTLLNSSLRTGGSLLDLFGILSSTSTLPLIDMDPSIVKALGALVNVSGAGARLNLAGPLFADVGGTVSTGTGDQLVKSLLAVQDGGALTGTTTQALVALTNTAFTSDGLVLSIVGGNSAVSLAGPLLRATGGSIVALDLVGILGGTLTSSTGDAFLQLTGTQVTLDDTKNGALGRLFEIAATGSTNDATATFKGPLLTATNATILLRADVLGVFNGATFTGTGTSPLLSFTGGSLSAPHGNLAFVNGASGGVGSTLQLAGPLMRATDATISLGTSALLVGNKATVTGTTASPFFQLDHSAVTVGGAFVSVDGANRQLSLAGPVLGAINQSTVSSTSGPLLSSTLTGLIDIASQTSPIVSFTGGSSLSAQSLLFAGLNDNAFNTHGSTGALFSFSGGTHTLSTGAFNAVDIRGTNTLGENLFVDDFDGGFFVPLFGANALASEQPLKHDGTLIDADNATLTTANGISFDRALFNASAPVLGLTRSTATVNGDAVSLVNNAKVTSGVSFVRLDTSTLNVIGSLVNVRTGSVLTVGGNLVQMVNGSTLNITNGALLNVGANSNVKIGGSLVNFSGGASTINITNNLCAVSCFFVSGLPIAGTGNVFTGGPGAVTGTGTINTSAQAAVIFVGAGANVSIGGQLSP